MLASSHYIYAITTLYFNLQMPLNLLVLLLTISILTKYQTITEMVRMTTLAVLGLAQWLRYCLSDLS